MLNDFGLGITSDFHVLTKMDVIIPKKFCVVNLLY